MIKNLLPGEWVIYADGTHGITFDNHKLCVFATSNVALQVEQNRDVTQSAWPMVMLGWLGGEWKDGVKLVQYVLMHWAELLFGIRTWSLQSLALTLPMDL